MLFAELAAEAFVAFDDDGKIIEWNPAAEELFGVKRSKALGKKIDTVLLFQPQKIRLKALIGEIIREEKVYFKDKHLLLSASDHKGDHHLFFSDITKQERTQEKLDALEKSPDLLLLLFDEKERLQEWIGEEGIFNTLQKNEKIEDLFLSEITKKEGQQEARTRSQVPVLLDISFGEGTTLIVRSIKEKEAARQKTRALESLLENSEEAAILIDATGKIHSWNQEAEKRYGWSEKEALQNNIEIIQNPIYQDKEAQALRKVIEGEGDQEIEIERWNRSGEAIPVSLSIGNIEESSLFSLIEHDKRMERRFENRIQFLSEHDEMTSLRNREGFMRETLEKALNTLDNTLLLFDVDNFKFVNEAYGHDIGDKLLEMIGEELDPDNSARCGADQFAILLEERDIDKAKDWSDNLLKKLQDKARQELHLPVGFSGGLIFLVPNDNRDGEEILNAAELALYRAKEKGRGTIVIDRTKERQINWSRKLERALQEDNLLLYAQPIQEISSGKTKSYELLLRLQDPDLGVVTPDKFLATAERLGLISEIDRWVAEEGIRLASLGISVEINLSGRSMTDENLFHFLARKIKKSRPENIVFEITETTAIASLHEAVEFSEKVRQLGCAFALDDFGVGFGSFSYLKHLPLEILKIDGEFIKNLPESRQDRAILESIVSLARGLDLTTIAEWVDSQETLQLLEEIGVDMAQGYYIGKPRPVNEII